MPSWAPRSFDSTTYIHNDKLFLFCLHACVLMSVCLSFPCACIGRCSVLVSSAAACGRRPCFCSALRRDLFPWEGVCYCFQTANVRPSAARVARRPVILVFQVLPVYSENFITIIFLFNYIIRYMSELFTAELSWVVKLQMCWSIKNHCLHWFYPLHTILFICKTIQNW